MRRILSTAAALGFTGVALAGCGGNSKRDDASATTAANSGTTLTLVAKNIAFDQSTLTAAAGDSVTFVIKNEDNTEHNLTIADLKVDKDAEAGKSATQTVTNLKPGTYQYHCEYHPAQMNGTLTVS